MKALSYKNAHTLNEFSLALEERERPTLRPHDLLIQVKAISVNPVDTKVRKSRSATDKNVILGWDAAGVVTAVGPEAKGFSVGDKVYTAGDLTRDGSYAEELAVDSRITAKMPTSLSFTDAAAVPLTALTAWEALLEDEAYLAKAKTVLVIAGAGGVGSMATQLLKAKSKARVITTASRPDTVTWSKSMGADDVINHKLGLKDELERLDIKEVDMVFSTTQTDLYLKTYNEILRPFGRLALIDDPTALDILAYKRKSISVHWELMFSKTLFSFNVESQGQILKEVAQLIDAGKVKTTQNKVLKGLTPENLKMAHEIQEKGTAIGKTVIQVAE